MSYTNASGRQQILDESAAAADELSTALAVLADAYEHLDASSADRVEEAVFKPLQAAYGQLRRTHAEFAARYGLSAHTFEPGVPGLPGDARQTPLSPPTRSSPSCRTRCYRWRSATNSSAPGSRACAR